MSNTIATVDYFRYRFAGVEEGVIAQGDNLSYEEEINQCF